MRSETRREVLAFRQARNWPATDTLENLTAALAEEAGELSEYIDAPDSPVGRQKRNREVGLAAADVAIYLIALCEHLDINLEQAIRSKMELLDEKYPTEIGRSKLILMHDGAYAAGGLPIEHLLELWGDYEIVDWNEERKILASLKKRLSSNTGIGVPFTISRAAWIIGTGKVSGGSSKAVSRQLWRNS